MSEKSALEKETRLMQTKFPYTVNRELSWLKFNERVLGEATSAQNPACERLKFLSIFINNLDEFYMIRVGSLYDQTLLDDMPIDNKTGLTAKEQLSLIFAATRPLYEDKDRAYRAVCKSLEAHGITACVMETLQEWERSYVEEYFTGELQPLLSAQIINTRHPFPHLTNKRLYVAARLTNHKNAELYGLVPVPSAVPRVLFLPGSSLRYVLLEDIILYYAERIFEIYSVSEKAVLCVTRNADLGLELDLGDEDTDFRQYMKEVLKKRNRLAPVRLEVQQGVTQELLQFFLQKLDLREKQVFTCTSPLDFSYISEIMRRIPDQNRQRLFYPKFSPQYPSYLRRGERLLKAVERRDLLLSYPYESIRPFLDAVREAAQDPNVVSIKITLYRIARESKLAENLILAAENGKDVTVVMELRARFDEQNNIDWANRLEKAGCRIVYGNNSYKVHAKICLITLRERGKLKTITQVGTGNYNEQTAELYTDYAYLTANEEIGRDAVDFFKNMDLDNAEAEYRRLLVAPFSFKTRILELIDREIAKGSHGSILLKLNSITDKDLIDKLAEASRAGVQIRMIVRGICCLKPGVEGATENISVVSVVGRFLEHTRVYIFGNGGDRHTYIASADFMTRNTERRIEIACPIDEPALARRIYDSLEHILRDNEKISDMLPDGSYVKRSSTKENRFNSQEYFIQEAKAVHGEYLARERKPDALRRSLQIAKRILGLPAAVE